MTAAVAHHTFVIEKTFAANPERVFAAWADPAIECVWFAEGEQREVSTFDLDFEVGGRERSSFRPKGGSEYRNETVWPFLVGGITAMNEFGNGRRLGWATPYDIRLDQ